MLAVGDGVALGPGLVAPALMRATVCRRRCRTPPDSAIGAYGNTERVVSSSSPVVSPIIAWTRKRSAFDGELGAGGVVLDGEADVEDGIDAGSSL